MFGNKIYKILSKEDLEKISSKIKTAEENTSAEIVVSIKNNIPFIFNNNINKFALSLFKFYKIYKTENKTGILILFVIKNKQFYILGDEGIYKKVDQKVWDDLSVSISKEINEKNLLEGVIKSIELTSALVDYHFPKSENDVNEISNEVKF